MNKLWLSTLKLSEFFCHFEEQTGLLIFNEVAYIYFFQKFLLLQVGVVVEWSRLLENHFLAKEYASSSFRCGKSGFADYIRFLSLRFRTHCFRIIWADLASFLVFLICWRACPKKWNSCVGFRRTGFIYPWAFLWIPRRFCIWPGWWRRGTALKWGSWWCSWVWWHWRGWLTPSLWVRKRRWWLFGRSCQRDTRWQFRGSNPRHLCFGAGSRRWFWNLAAVFFWLKAVGLIDLYSGSS